MSRDIYLPGWTCGADKRGNPDNSRISRSRVLSRAGYAAKSREGSPASRFSHGSPSIVVGSPVIRFPRWGAGVRVLGHTAPTRDLKHGPRPLPPAHLPGSSSGSWSRIPRELDECPFSFLVPPSLSLARPSAGLSGIIQGHSQLYSSQLQFMFRLCIFLNIATECNV